MGGFLDLLKATNAQDGVSPRRRPALFAAPTQKRAKSANRKECVEPGDTNAKESGDVATRFPSGATARRGWEFRATGCRRVSARRRGVHSNVTFPSGGERAAGPKKGKCFCAVDGRTDGRRGVRLRHWDHAGPGCVAGYAGPPFRDLCRGRRRGVSATRPRSNRGRPPTVQGGATYGGQHKERMHMRGQGTRCSWASRIWNWRHAGNAVAAFSAGPRCGRGFVLGPEGERGWMQGCAHGSAPRTGNSADVAKREGQRVWSYHGVGTVGALSRQHASRWRDGEEERASGSPTSSADLSYSRRCICQVSAARVPRCTSYPIKLAEWLEPRRRRDIVAPQPELKKRRSDMVDAPN
ncbi:hypothetical protein C8J57DRAFT_1246345 [Mycena rebaudengoi]|nr:hypothetical protein C8J57DRAFT_1246345 [Mycena rebaudengoi]